MRLHGVFGLGVMLAGLLGGGAASAQSCTGTYYTTLLHALPAAPVMALDLRDDSDFNLALRDRFNAGAREVGAPVDGRPNLRLLVTYRISSPGGQGDAIRGERFDSTYSGFSELRGDRYATPQMATRTPGGAIPDRTLYLRADLVEPATLRPLWLAVVQCRLLDDDPGGLAHDLGRLIGGAMGRTVGSTAF
jgi:hypothetical protein